MLTDGFHMQTEPEEYDEFKYIHCTMYCLGLIWINPNSAQNEKNKKKQTTKKKQAVQTSDQLWKHCFFFGGGFWG